LSQPIAHQGAGYDQARVSFDCGRIGEIKMDPMGVPERRVVKKQLDRIHLEFTAWQFITCLDCLDS
jgi:hypothetical protein